MFGETEELTSLELDDDLSYQERPRKILACEVKELCSRIIPLVKVQWSHRDESKAI